MNENPPVRVGDRIVPLEQYAPRDPCAKVGEAYTVGQVDGNTVRVRVSDGHLCLVDRWRLADDPYRPQVGDTVRLKGTEMVGEVESVSEADDTISVKFDDEAEEYGWFKPERLERAAEPEPEYRLGDIVRDNVGNVWGLADDDAEPDWFCISDSEIGWRRVRDLAHPLTLLVHDGKPVGAA